MKPSELVKACELLNPSNKPGRLTVIVRMGAENVREKLPHLIRAIRQSGFIVTWVSDPMHGNTIRAPSGLKTRPFDLIRVTYYVFDGTWENAKFNHGCLRSNFTSKVLQLIIPGFNGFVLCLFVGGVEGIL